MDISWLTPIGLINSINFSLFHLTFSCYCMHLLTTGTAGYRPVLRYFLQVPVADCLWAPSDTLLLRSGDFTDCRAWGSEERAFRNQIQVPKTWLLASEMVPFGPGLGLPHFFLGLFPLSHSLICTTQTPFTMVHVCTCERNDKQGAGRGEHHVEPDHG